jgi:hypothetical protein
LVLLDLKAGLEAQEVQAGLVAQEELVLLEQGLLQQQIQSIRCQQFPEALALLA